VYRYIAAVLPLLLLLLLLIQIALHSTAQSESLYK
jgi:hypothetical protein